MAISAVWVEKTHFTAADKHLQANDLRRMSDVIPPVAAASAYPSQAEDSASQETIKPSNARIVDLHEQLTNNSCSQAHFDGGP
jgi:hypothetical protein